MPIVDGTIDFGAFPGSPSATAEVTGQTGILVSSSTQAELVISATADHSADEVAALAGKIRITAGPAVAGVGFTVFASYENSEGKSANSACIHGLFNFKGVWV